MARFFRTEDGKAVGLYLLREQTRVLAPGVDSCALHDNEGRRRFAQELANMKDADQRADAGKPKPRRRYDADAAE